MQIWTDIAPRRDGTLILRVKGEKLVFVPDGQKRLVCDVPADLSAAVLSLPRFNTVDVPPSVVAVPDSPRDPEPTKAVPEDVAAVKAAAAAAPLAPKARTVKAK